MEGHGALFFLIDGEIFYSPKEAQILIEDRRRHCNVLHPRPTPTWQPPAPEIRNMEPLV